MAKNIMSRQQWRLMQTGRFTEEEARRLAYKQQQRRGHTEGRTFKQSEVGTAWAGLGSDQRALYRRLRERAKRDGNPESYYQIVNGSIRLLPQFRRR